MEDSDILQLFLLRDEDALAQTTEKYGTIGHQIAINILGNAHDADEVWDDALMKLWTTIPPKHPQSLFAYLAVMIRNTAFDRCRAEHRKKRFGEQVHLALDEFAECIPAEMNLEDAVDSKQLMNAVNHFVSKLPSAVKALFLQRYWAMMPTEEIARKYGLNENTVKSTLRRTREKLRTYLIEEGYL